METAELSLRARGGGEYRGQMGVAFSEWAERVGGSSALWEEPGGVCARACARASV